MCDRRWQAGVGSASSGVDLVSCEFVSLIEGQPHHLTCQSLLMLPTIELRKSSSSV